MKKIGRNENCPCGSGKKYKFCCYNINSNTKDVSYNKSSYLNSMLLREKLIETIDSLINDIVQENDKLIYATCEGTKMFIINEHFGGNTKIGNSDIFVFDKTYLTAGDCHLFINICNMITGEYIMLNQFDKPSYVAMKIQAEACKQIIQSSVIQFKKISIITIFEEDEHLKSWNIDFRCESESFDLIQDEIMWNWQFVNEDEKVYLLNKNTLLGFDEESKRSLATTVTLESKIRNSDLKFFSYGLHFSLRML